MLELKEVIMQMDGLIANLNKTFPCVQRKYEQSGCGAYCEPHVPLPHRKNHGTDCSEESEYRKLANEIRSVLKAEIGKYCPRWWLFTVY